MSSKLVFDLLRQDGGRKDIEEMFQCVQKFKSYAESLLRISEYVQTQLSRENYGVVEKDTIKVDKELFIDEEGVTAIVDFMFEFDNVLHNKEKEYVELHVTWHPETEHFNATIYILENDYIGTRENVHLFLEERRLILSEMERVAHKHYNKSLRELFADWKKDYEDRQTKIPEKEKQKQRYE